MWTCFSLSVFFLKSNPVILNTYMIENYLPEAVITRADIHYGMSVYGFGLCVVPDGIPIFPTSNFSNNFVPIKMKFQNSWTYRKCPNFEQCSRKFGWTYLCQNWTPNIPKIDFIFQNRTLNLVNFENTEAELKPEHVQVRPHH